MILGKTKFNKKAIEGMTFKAFEKLYKSRLAGVDLKAVFVENGGKIDQPKKD